MKAINGIVNAPASGTADIKSPSDSQPWGISTLLKDGNITKVELTNGTVFFDITSLLPIFNAKLVITNTFFIRITAGASAGNCAFTGIEVF